MARATRGACWPTRGRARAGLRGLRHVGGRGADPRGRARHGADRARPPPGRRAPAARHPGQPGAGPAGRGPPRGRGGGAHARAGAGRAARTAARLAPDPDEAIDLVALATVADAVPLVGDNRRRVARGPARDARAAPPGHRGPLRRGRPRAPRAQRPRARASRSRPCINAAGRLAHPDRALELLLAADREAADPIGARAVGAQRRAPRGGARDRGARPSPRWRPSPTRSARAGIVVASGDGWHEGVVGIVASRLAERFERPAIVLSRQGDTRQGVGPQPAGRRPPRAGRRRRPGRSPAGAGTPGRSGLELPAAAIARFRDELIARRRGRARRDRAGAGARRWTPSWAGATSRLATAEALEAPRALRARQPAGAPGGARRRRWSRRRGWGRGEHLQVRLRSAGVHARAIGFRMGERAAGHRRGRAPRRRRRARGRALAGHRRPAREPRGARAARAAARRSPASAPRPATRAAPTGSARDRPAGDGRRRRRARRRRRRRAGAPLGVRDRRGRGRRARPILAALAGADRGVVAVVADVRPPPRGPGGRARAGRGWAPRWPCSAARAATRARWRRGSRWRAGCPALAMLDYARLAEVEPPRGHAPGAGRPARLAAGRPRGPPHRAAGRWLHLVWGDARDRGGAAGGRGRVGAAAGRHGALDSACATARPRALGPRAGGRPAGRRAGARGPRGSPRAPSRVLAELGLVEVGERRACAPRPAPSGASSRPPSATAPSRGASTRRAPSSASPRRSTSSHPSSPLWPRRRARAGPATPRARARPPSRRTPCAIRWLLIAAAAAVAVPTATARRRRSRTASSSTSRWRPTRWPRLKIGKVPQGEFAFALRAASDGEKRFRLTQQRNGGSQFTVLCGAERPGDQRLPGRRPGSLICTGITTPADTRQPHLDLPAAQPEQPADGHHPHHRLEEHHERRIRREAKGRPRVAVSFTYGEGSRRPRSRPRVGRPRARRSSSPRSPSTTRTSTRDAHPARLRVRRGAPPRPAAQLRRAVHHAPPRVRAHLRGARPGRHRRRGRAAARHGRGHRRHARATSRRDFGAEVAALVDGVTKLSKIHFESQEEHQAENYRKLIVSMSSDIRVLIIKLADRLHNMRTLAYMTKPKQIQKAKETLEVYAPLAHRLGIHSLKWELEDLAFATLHPQALQRDPADGQPAPAGPRGLHRGGRRASSASELEAVGITGVEITGRAKHFYSIYEKMTRKGKEFNEIYDLTAMRVLVDSVKDCYGAVGHHPLALEAPARALQGLHRDAQAQHVPVPAHHGDRARGQAARDPDPHLRDARAPPSSASPRTGSTRRATGATQPAWVLADDGLADARRRTRASSWRRCAPTSTPDEVYVFTPKGEVRDLPAGATPLDFAYDVHTDVGHRCVGAKVNGRIVPLTYTLAVGRLRRDPHLQGRRARPSRDWLTAGHHHQGALQDQPVLPPRAARGRRAPRPRGPAGAAAQGGPARASGWSGSPLLLEVIQEMGFKKADEFYISLGLGKTSVQIVVNKILHRLKAGQAVAEDAAPVGARRARPPHAVGHRLQRPRHRDRRPRRRAGAPGQVLQAGARATRSWATSRWAAASPSTARTAPTRKALKKNPERFTPGLLGRRQPAVLSSRDRRRRLGPCPSAGGPLAGLRRGRRQHRVAPTARWRTRWSTTASRSRWATSRR